MYYHYQIIHYIYWGVMSVLYSLFDTIYVSWIYYLHIQHCNFYISIYRIIGYYNYMELFIYPWECNLYRYFRNWVIMQLHHDSSEKIYHRIFHVFVEFVPCSKKSLLTLFTISLLLYRGVNHTWLISNQLFDMCKC